MVRKFPKIINKLLFIGIITIPSIVFADANLLPQNPSVINGSAVISKNDKTLTIQQDTNKLITNWSSFNIDKDHTVKFIQPQSTSSALNRVQTNDPTYIYGNLTANGNVILINPNGVIFKDGSKVDVGSIIASSLNMKNNDFLNNKIIFEKEFSAGSIENNGKISAFEGGAVALIGQQVTNNGEITTPNGSASLISGEKVTLSLNGNKLINYSIDRGIINSLVANNNAIKVNNGTVILSAKGIDEVSKAVINNSGSIVADGISQKGGRIFLSASNGKIINSGSIAANSDTGKGGKIRVTGDEILIQSGSKLSSKGNTGGGVIEVGGSWQNNNNDVYQATTTIVKEGASLDASAYDFGDGGEIVVWSNIHKSNSKTTVKGTLKADGGKINGNGGKIETSGRSLDINDIEISTKSNIGEDGQWLIDPYNITISNGSSSDINGSYTATGNSAVINVGTLETALASNNVTVFTGNSGSQNGNITVDASITSSSSNDLTLDSNRHIYINSNITRSGSGGLILEPGSNNVYGSGTINLASGSSISTSSGATVRPNINLSSSGNVDFTGSGTTTYSGSISGSGNLNKTGSGTVVLSGSNSYSGSTILNAGTLRIDNSSSVPSNNSLTSNGGTYNVNSNVTLAGLSGSGGISVASGRTLTVNNSSGGTFSGIISGSGGFTKDGSQSFTFLNNNTYTGSTTISGGELTAKGLLGDTNISLASGTILGFDAGDDTIGSISGSGLIDIPSGMTITSSLSSGSTTYSGDLSGDGNFVKDGNYTLTLSGSNSITGTKTINAGILSISSDNNLGAVPGSVQSSHLIFGGGTLQTTADFTLNANRGVNLSGNGTIHTNTSTQLDYSGLIQGSGNLTKSGSGTLLFSTANNFTGNLNLDGGTLSISAVDQLGRTTGSNTITFDGGTLLATSDFTFDTNRGMSLDGNGGFNVDSGVVLDYAGVISGAGALTKSGLGNFLISGANTYSGDTVITAGTLQVTGTLADTTDVIVSSGALYNVDEDDTIQSLESAGNIDIANTKTLQTGDNGNNAISGVISGAGSLIKLGSGTLTLSGTNTNTGSMGIQAGTLSISTDRNLGAVPGSVDADSIILNGGILKSTGSTTLDSNRGVTIYAPSTIEVDGSSTDLTISGIVTGGAGANLIKTGAGRLIMGGVNTYVGSTAINAGTLSVSADSGLGAVPGSTTADHLTINGGILQSTSSFTLNTKRGITLGASSGTINTINSSQLNYVGVIAGSSNLTKNGDGRILLIGNSTYSGNTVISEGNFTNLGTLADTTNVSVASGAIYDVDNTDTINSLSGAGNVELASGVTLTTGDAGTDIISGVISGPGNLTKAGSGTLTLSGINTYTGTTTISSGTVSIAADSGLGAAPGLPSAGHLTLNGGTLESTANFTLNSNRGIALGASNGIIDVNSGTTLTYGGIMAGSGTLTKVDSGTLTLSGVNTYSGSTTISAGTISISDDSGLGAAPGSATAGHLTLNGATLHSSDDFTLNSNRGIALGTSHGTINVDGSKNLTYGGIIAGSNNLTKSGDGTLLLLGVNTYSGNTAISDGTLQTSGTLADTTDVSVSSGAIYDVDATDTIQSLSGAGNIELADGITLTTGDAGTDTISGVISGPGNLVKVGSGTLTLSGTNTYTGITTISSGVLKISGLLGSGTHSANIINNSTLNYDSSSNQNLSGVISGTGLLTQDGSGTLTLSGVNTYAGTTTINSGTINISADSGLGSAPGSATAGHLTLNGGTLQSSADFTMNANRGVALGSSHGTFNVDTGTTLTVGGVVAGSNNLIKSGDGTLILSGVNTYSGNTTISSGTLEVSGLLGSGTYSANISNSGTFEYSSSSNQAISGVISGTGDIVKGGTGELTLSGSNTYSLMTMNDGFIIISSDSGLGVPPGSATPGHLTFNGGTLRTTASFTLNSNRGINLISQGTIITDPGTTLTYGGIIAGTGNFIKDGTGTLVLGGSNTNTGYIKIQAGVLSVSSTSNLGAIPGSVDSDNIQMINGTLHVSSTFTLNSNKGILLQSGLGSATAIFDIDSGQTLTIPGVISGNGTASITKNGSGTLELTGINTHTATTDINAGSLSINSDSALGATPGSATAGHLTIDASLITTADFTLNPNRGIAISSGYTAHLKPASGTSLTYGGIIAGAGNIRNWYGITILGGVNTYTGTTTARSGTISISSDRNLGAVPGSATAGKIVLHGGTLKSTADFTIDSNRGISLGSQHGTINVDSGTTLTYNGITASSGRLTKSGTGKLVFGGANTYTGDTIISAGTFQTTGTLADTTDVSVSSGAIYDVDATDTIQSLSGAGNIEFANSITLTTGDAGDDTISGVISGAGNFTKAGSGTLTLSGTNTYTGDTTISAGTLLTSGTLADTTDVLVSSGAILDVDITDTIQSLSGAGNIELASGITLTTGDSDNDTISGVISGVGNLVKIGSGTLTLSGTNTYTGSTVINVGAIRISADSGLGAAPSSITADHLTINGGTLTSTADFTLSSNRGVALGSSHGTFRVNGSTTLTVAGIVSGSNNLIKSASGTLILSGVNTYSGTTTINGGTLNISGQLGSGSYSNTISNSGTFEISSSSNQTISGVISNSGNLVKSGSGTLTLSATNTFTGTTTINGGVVSISAEVGLGATPGSAAAGHLTLNGGTLRFTSSFTLNSNRGIALGTSHGTIDLDTGLTLTYGGIIAGSNNLTKSGSGTLLLSGVNTYSGQTIISVGTFQVTGSLADTNDVSVSSGATYDVDATDTIQSLSGAGNIELASGITLTTGDGGNDTLSGVISGAGNIVKAGSGTLTLSGANTYTGTTTISGGTISIAADNGLGAVPGSATAGHLTLNGGALQSTADFTLNSNRGIALGVSNGTINVDGSTTLTYGGIIAGSGSFTKIGSGMLVLTSQLSTYSGGTINNAGTLKLAATSVGSLGSATSGPIGTGSLTNNAILDVDGNLIHNTKNNNGSIINKPVPVTNFSSSSLAVIYGDTVTNNFTTDTNGSKTFSSSNTSSATINSSNGTVALVKVGNTTMSVALAETNEYASATDSYTLAISPKTITASASASNKVYDGTSTATTALTFSGLVGLETLGQTVAATFSDKNVGTGKTVTVNSITLADGTNGGLAVNYSISSGQTTTANITAKPLTVSGITASNKIYDSTTSSTLGTGSVSYGGLVSGDNLTGTYSGVFNNANVGTGKTVTITSSYSGADVNNYTITDQASTSADVTAKALTATASASNKVYNSLSAATVTLSLSGFIGSETVTSTNSSTFDNKNVGTGKTVTVNSITLANGSNGGLAANYSISTGQTTTANITAKALTASASTSNKVYDGLTTATTTLTFSGLVGSETLGQTVASTFSDKNVATGKTVTVNSITLADGSNGGLAANYSISAGQTTTANITAKSLTVSGITASNKIYDSTTSSTLGTGSVSYGGLVSGDDFVGSYSGVFADANVGTGKTVNITSSYSGADVNNYSVTDQSTTTANITAKALTATASASNKVYNSSSAATVTLSLSGFIGSETVTSTNSSTFNDKNVATGKTVTVNSITLADGSNGGLAANYSISTGQTTTANVTAKPLTVSGITTSNKTYDGNSVATLNTSSVAYSGLVSGDTFNGTYTGAFSDKNVGTGKTVTITPSYSGADVNNYSITNHSTITANITTKSLTVSGITASNKIYDSTTSSTLGTGSVSYGGLVSGDDFVGSYSGVFADANVGTGKTVNITSSYSGADVNNYSVTDQSTTTANITAKALTATASASNKVYNSSSAATVTLSLSGFIGSETVTSTNSSTFNDKNVATGKTVTVNSITLADGSNGGLAANYSISTGQTTTANITAKPLTVSGITTSNKTYDGNSVATLNTSSVAYSGLVSGDTFNGTYTGAFSDKNVGTGKTVTITPSYSGADVNNYSITNHAVLTANITVRSLTVSGVAALDKTYDGSVTATMDSSSAVYSGFVSGDDFAASYSGVFANANVGSGKTVTITSSYAGADVSNYNITNQSSTTADINKKVLLLSTFSASDKAYDGNNTPTISSAVSGFVGSETVSHSMTATFDNKDVGSNKVVTANSITLADGTNGGLASNYSISTGQTTTANITAKTLTATASSSNKVYDGLTTATTTLTFSGLIGSETLGQTVASTFNNKNVATSKAVTVNSIVLANGSNGGLAGNYSISPGQTTTANITAKALTVSGITALNKTYDSTTSATLDSSSVSYSGIVTGDTFTGSYSGLFANANVGTGKTVNITSSYSGADVNNYTVTDQSSTTADIVAKALTATASTANKTYNRSTTATTTLTFTGLVGSETLGQTVGSTFDNKNVGTGKTVTVNSITLADGSNGGLAANYSISAGQTTTANITAKSLTVSGITSSNKTYDGNTVATLDASSVAYSGLVSGDIFNGTYTGAFSDKNVGSGKTVTITSSYTGADVGNYSVTDQSSTTANITAKALTVSGITSSSKTYDGSTSATLDSSSVTYSGLLSGDTFTGGYSGLFANANVGTGKTVNITSSYSGADAGNYTVTNQSSTTADIAAKALTATASTANKTYNAATTASTTLTFTGLIGSETLGQTVGSTFDNKNVGTGKTVTVNSITLADGSNGGLAANYSISAGQTSTANITAKSLTVSGITASNKIYDGNTVVTLDTSSVTYSGLVSGDSFAGSYSGLFSDKNIGTGKTVSITSSYSGSDVNNYTVTDQSSTTANITSRPLGISGITVFGLTVNNKEYDGTVTAPLDTSSVSYSGLVTGDDVTGSYSGVFANANVGSGKTVTITSSYSGADAGNYSVTDQSSTIGNIVPKVLTATTSTANKTYNRSTTATTTLTLTGLIGSETLGITNSSTFNNKNVGAGKSVTVNSITLADGSNGGLASNYSISAGQTTTANITAKSLTVSGITASNKAYDGNTVSTLDASSVAYSGLVSGDTFNGTYTGAFSDKNVGTGKTVTITPSYTGADVSNYSVTDQSSTTANITAKALTVSGITSSSKTYDGSTSATLDSSSVTYTGLLSGDTFNGSYTGAFSNANVGSGKTVNITSSYSGADAGNYTVTDQSSTTADIAAKALTATASASNKTYNGSTTAATTLTFTGLVGTETLGQTVGSTFDNKNVGSNKTVTVNSITLADGSNGGLAANYSINAGQTSTAHISPKILTVSGNTASNKIYDGNSSATVSVSLSGFIGSETLTHTNSSSFNNKNIGAGKTVTVNSIILADGANGGLATNYSVTPGQTTTANLTAKALTISGITSSSKTYNGSTSATLDTTSVIYSGLVSGDTFNGAYTGAFSNANVGSGKTVTITSSYSGADVNNYTVTGQSSTTADITAKALTATVSVSNKTYDATNTGTSTLSISGLVGSETLGITNSSTFNNKNVGTGKTVTVNSITLADGSNGGLAGNYSISAGQTSTANITAKSLTVLGITASNKTYDGNTVSTLDASSVTYSGIISGDTFNGTYTGAFSDKNVGSGKTVTITSSYTGADVSNYSVTDQSSTTANITAKALTVSGITSSSKTYDGSASATLDSSSVTYTGLLSGDTFTGSYSGMFANANVGTGKTVTITSSYSGADVNNYTVTDQSSTTADIAAKALTATASTANKTYNGATTASTTLTFTGLVGSETLAQTIGSTFDNKNVGSNKTVTVNSITLADGSGLAANYSISAGQTTTANVTAKSLTVSGITASNKTYDGNTVSTLDASSVAYSGLVGGDIFNGTYTGAFSDKNVGSGKTVTIAPSYSGADVSNYSISNHADVTANITAKALTVSGITASSKTYDGSASATLDTSSVLYSGLVSGDTFNGTYTGAFSNANVGTGKTVTITSSYSGADTGNYSVTDQSSTTADISTKALTATASASNKTYDGSTTASTTLTFSGLVGSETLGQTVGSTFDNKNVGSNKTVTVNSITLADGSGLAVNYSISAGQTTTANITAKSLTVSGITGINKVYDGNAVVTLDSSSVTYSGLVSGDSFVGAYSGVFANANVDTGKTVTITSSYSGSDVNNYVVTDQSTTTANITSRPAGVSGITVFGLSVNNKEYDGTVTAPLDTSSILYTGILPGDDVTGSYSGVFTNPNVGSTKTVNITSSYSGADSGNYSFTDQSTTTGNIVPKVLTATASASNKTYDGATTASTTLTFTGLVGSETLAQTIGSTFDNKNVGSNKTVTVNSITLADGSNGGLAANYSISAGQTTTANITVKSLSVSGITSSNKAYDGNTVATLNATSVAYSGLVSGDTFNGTYTGAFSDKNVGTGKTVTITSSYTGADVSNYSVTNQSSTTANITAKALTVSGITALNKTYDSTTSATLDSSSVSYSGIVTGDTFTGSYSGLFANANVGTGKTVNITSSYSGADVNNYTVTDQSSTTADIVAKALTATASTANKTYNRSTTATTTLTFTGLIGSETLGQTVGSTFDNKNVGTGKTVTVNSITLADGSNGGLAANYSISAGQTSTANITAKSLTVSGITSSNKTYDGNTVATLDASSVAYSGLVSGDIFNGTYTGAFSDKNVGSGKTVTITSSYTGADVGNYSVTDQSSTTANITAKALTVSGITSSSKTYDATTSATLNTGSLSYGGLVSGDNLTGTYSGVFNNANVGSGKTVTITSSYSGADVNNYTITDQASTTADVIAKALTATASASNKVYDGSSTATSTLSLSGFIGSETVTSTNSSTFNNKNVGTGKTVTINSITLADGSNGGLAANYSISTGQTTTANVTAKALTVSGITALNKTYDGGTNATTTLSFSGFIGSETINNINSSTFDNKTIGTAKAVTVNSITLVDGNNGGLGSNYSISSGQTTTADISAKLLTVSGISASNKSYDGTTSVTLDTSSVNYNGLVSGDDLTGSFSGVFVNDNIGTGRVINITSSYSGDDIGNYNIINQNTHFADITIGNPTISGLSNQTKSFTTSSYTLTGTPSISGLPIVYSSSDTSVATVNSSTGEVTFVNVGSVTISANIVSTLNYNSTTSSYLLEINLNTTNFNSDSSSSIVKQISVLQTRASSSETFNLRTVVKQNDANVSAKVVVIKDNLNANVDSLYTEESGDGKLSTDFIDEEEKEKFDKPGDIIKEKTIVLKISDNESYNYKLEFRQKGLVIKPLDTNSGYFANLNKSVVIKSAITEIKNIAGYLKNQIKTIIFDLANKL